ncbi:MAG: hypothetical protein QOJ15_2109 [Bradyrhizobium sp.]|nr:hypothetical protein [Bradyrhizobium sp.]
MSIDPIAPQGASRHIYPKLAQRLTSADLRRLFRPSYEERRWVPTIARTPSSQVALLVQLKTFQAVGRFLPVEEIPQAAIEHVARELGVDDEIRHLYSDSTLYRHHSAVLERLRITAWGAAARELARRTMVDIAQVRTDPADLINAAGSPPAADRSTLIHRSSKLSLHRPQRDSGVYNLKLETSSIIIRFLYEWTRRTMRTWDRQTSHTHALTFSRELRSDLICESPPVEHRDKHVG